ncbi:hypothetical protein P3X46_008492 [Hevea brasiliensis]|uniref:Uncharacterized GPI-anchored protein At5g19230-like domain-containing protein n=1 Tax=Hevea brasiliensis TaxID=3981 RepID=A0ABQ9MMM7_HEVBR|nr:uncharacterized GPI-anchored protein At3g06035-like [Hevea brasiliensis]KAJ9180220.1 hypothetical protein P3X46_008492 [Hevea brasiliensis]
MASLKLIKLFLFVLLHAIFLLSSSVLCDDKDEHNVLQGLNSYRTSLRLPPLSRNENAGCLAHKIADKLENQPCNGSAGATSVQLDNYSGLLSKCGIDINSTKDGAVLPVCVPKLVPTLVLTNYTRTQLAKYLNDSRFTGAGLGSEDDWMVVVLSTDTPSGSFAGATSLMSTVGFGHCLVCLLVGMLVYVLVY